MVLVAVVFAVTVEVAVAVAIVFGKIGFNSVSVLIDNIDPAK